MLRDSINNYDEIIVEVMSHKNDADLPDNHRGSAQLRVSVEALRKSYNPYHITYTSYDTRNTTYYIHDNVLTVSKASSSEIHGTVAVYGIKYVSEQGSPSRTSDYPEYIRLFGRGWERISYPKIPSYYTRVYGIRASSISDEDSTQIDTGLVFNTNNFTINICGTSRVLGTYAVVHANAYVNEGTDVVRFINNGSSNTSLLFNANTRAGGATSITLGENTLVSIGKEDGKETVLVNDSTRTTGNVQGYPNDSSFALFGEPQHSLTVGSTAMLKCFFAYINGICVADYIPVIRNDGVAGFYDNVSKQFKTSADGGRSLSVETAND